MLGSGYGETGLPNCSSIQASKPSPCTRARVSESGPKAACSRNRPATAAETTGGPAEPTVTLAPLTDIADPGSGFCTMMGKTPFCVAVPVTVRRLADTKVVVNGVPPIVAIAPLMNALPLSVNVNGPCGITDGFADA